MAQVIICLRCLEDAEHHCRNLCRPCYAVAHRLGELDKYPASPQKRRLLDTLEEVKFLRSCGVDDINIYRRLGYTSLSSFRETVSKALKRQRLQEERVK